jgi:DNA-binding CsgD family transcriptional regulator/predicted DNA-binding protein
MLPNHSDMAKRLSELNEHMKTDMQSVHQEIIEAKARIKDYQLYLTNLKRIKAVQEQIMNQNVDENFQRELIKIMQKFPKVTSMRQAEVIYYMVQLKPNKEIAMLMNISDKTVRFHKTDIFQKTGVSSSMQLVREYLGMDEKYSKAPSDELPIGKAT